MRMGLLLASLASVVLLGFATTRDSTELPARGRKADPNALREAAMNNAGDPKQGKAIYLSAAAKCASCHKVHGQGSDVGPDLSQIGGKLDRTHLIESILDPSAEIVQGYHAPNLRNRPKRCCRP